MYHFAFNRDLMTSFHEDAQFTVGQTGRWQTVHNYYRPFHFLNTFFIAAPWRTIHEHNDKNDRIRCIQVLFSVLMFMLSLSLLVSSILIRLAYLFCSLT